MPYLPHEALVELFRTRPVLTAELLRDALGPNAVPVVKDVHEAVKNPELAVLSAMACGRSDEGIAVVITALAACAELEAGRAQFYAQIVLASMSDASRKVLEEVVMSLPNYEYQSEFVRKNVLKGRLEGQLEPLVHQFERRLRRSLTADERALLATRIREQGVEHVSDLVLDLSTEALAAWLG